jgi:CubicO group peptidase (beta-lactamase class C family)
MGSIDTESAVSALPKTEAALQHGIDAGWHLGGQLCVIRHGELLFDDAFGEAKPGRPMSRDDLTLWLSASKPVTAVLLARYWENGAFELDDPVARHIPEFAAHGKEGITIRHLLTHTAGIRMLDVGWPGRSWDEILDHIASHRPEPRWTPGQRAGYHMASSWFVLGELIQRFSDRPFADAVRQEIFTPLGMTDCWIGMPPERYRAYGDRIAPTWDTEKPSRPNHGWDSERRCTRPSPGGNGRGPMRQLVRFYAMLLQRGSLDGERIISSQCVEALTARHRVGMVDRTFKVKIDWGLGFILNSAYYGQAHLPYAYGPLASNRTFGHSGYRSTVAFADPEYGLAVALAFNGTPSDADHERRIKMVLGALYRDLELTS